MGKGEKRERGEEDCSTVKMLMGSLFKKIYCINILLLKVPMKLVHRDLDSARSCCRLFSTPLQEKSTPELPSPVPYRLNTPESNYNVKKRFLALQLLSFLIARLGQGGPKQDLPIWAPQNQIKSRPFPQSSGQKSSPFSSS